MYLHCIHTIRKILVYIFFLSGVSVCSASSDTLVPLLSYKHFGEEEGLSCKSVYEALQDKDGFMWFGTDAGVFRYDGKFFKRYTTTDGLGDNEILKLHQDRSGRIWFLSLNGNLSFWKDGKIYNSANTPFLKNAYSGGSTMSCYEDTRGRIWIGISNYGFTVITGDSVSKIKFPSNDWYGSYFMHEDLQGNTWSFDDGYRLVRYPANKLKDTIWLPANLRNLSGCHVKNSLDFMYVSSGKIYRVHDRSVSHYGDVPENISLERIINVVAEGDYLWAFTSGQGCVEFFKGKFSKRYFENSTVTFVFRDRENNLWFNTMGEGVYMIPASSNYIESYNAAVGLPGNNIISIGKRNNEIWLGYTNGIVSKIENNHHTTFSVATQDNPNFNRVISLLPHSDAVFCGTDNGIFTIQDKQKIKFISRQLNNELYKEDIYAVKQLFIDKEKNIFAANSEGLLIFLKTADDYKHIFEPASRVFSVTEYKNRILFSATGGLMEYIPGKTPVEFKTEVDFSSIRVLDMRPDNDGKLVLATSGNGIYFLKDKKLNQHLTTSNGLSDNNCKRIFVSDENIYVSTDNGLNILAKHNNYWNVSAVVTTNDGLISNTINDVVESNGVVYAATEKGLSFFKWANGLPEKFVGKVYVTEIITDSARTVTDSSYSFKSDIPRLLIRFAYPVFNPANELTVKYRMLQSETDNSAWVSSKNHEVEFSSLSPGQYIFQLMPDAQSVSTADVTNFYINIIPLWWQTNLARVIFVLLIVGLIILIIRKGIEAQYKKQLKELTMLEAERSRIASDMHDDIGADLTQISMWSNILNSSENRDKTVLSRITKSSNEVLQKMEQIIWALNSFQNHTIDVISYLREYASQYLESAGINLSYEVSGTMPELEVSAIQKRNIFLTVKELLHNTVKHSGAKNVSILIYTEGFLMSIEYKDDGKGFTPREKEDGMGNITVQKRMKEINSTISVKSSPGQGFSAHLKIGLVQDNKSIKN